MAVKDDKVRKLVTLEKTLWAQVEEFRWAERMKSESDAIRALIKRGLKPQTARRTAPRE